MRQSRTTRSLHLPLNVEVLESRDLLAVISNGIASSVVGHFRADVQDGGRLGALDVQVTARGVNELFEAVSRAILAYENYAIVGNRPAAIGLGFFNSTTTQEAIRNRDTVTSAGIFDGANGPINWRVETRFEPRTTRLVQTVTFTSAIPGVTLGPLTFANYLSQALGDTEGSQELLVLSGTPGEADFELLLVDNLERIGFGQSGIYLPGPGLVNAIYVGFVAARSSDLQRDLLNAEVSFAIRGNIDISGLSPKPVRERGPVIGPDAIDTAMGWQIDPNAFTASITTFLRLIPEPLNIVLVPPGDKQDPAQVPIVPPVFRELPLVATIGSSMMIGGQTVVFNPDDEAFLRQLYRDLLNREPDPTGLTYFQTNLARGMMNREAVALAVLKSPEFFGVEVDKFYLRFLNRPSDPLGRQFFVDQLVRGASETDVVVQIATSAEYFATNRIQNDTQFVQQLYLDILERQGEPAGVNAHVTALRLGWFTRAQIVGNFLASDEAYEGVIDFARECILRQHDDSSLVGKLDPQLLFALLDSGAFDPRDIKALVLGSEDYLKVARALKGNSKSAVGDGIGINVTGFEEVLPWSIT